MIDTILIPFDFMNFVTVNDCLCSEKNKLELELETNLREKKYSNNFNISVKYNLQEIDKLHNKIQYYWNLYDIQLSKLEKECINGQKETK